MSSSQYVPGWMRAFVGCCYEGAWQQAAEIVSTHSVTDVMIARHPNVSRALAEFARRAPMWVVENLQSTRWMGVGAPSELWRAAFIDRLIHGHARLVREATADGDVEAIAKHLKAAIALRAPTTAGEAIIAGAFSHACSGIGRAEDFISARRDLGQRYPSLFQREKSSNRVKGYHPDLLASCVRDLVENAASEALLQLAIRAIATNARSPSWGALAHIISTDHAALADSVRIVISTYNSELTNEAIDSLNRGLQARSEDLP